MESERGVGEARHAYCSSAQFLSAAHPIGRVTILSVSLHRYLGDKNRWGLFVSEFWILTLFRGFPKIFDFVCISRGFVYELADSTICTLASNLQFCMNVNIDIRSIFTLACTFVLRLIGKQTSRAEVQLHLPLPSSSSYVTSLFRIYKYVYIRVHAVQLNNKNIQLAQMAWS